MLIIKHIRPQKLAQKFAKTMRHRILRIFPLIHGHSFMVSLAFDIWKKEDEYILFEIKALTENTSE